MANGNYIEMTFPSKLQKYDNDCGVACMEAVLTFFGFSELEDGEVMKIAKTDKTGTSIRGLARVARNYDLKYKKFQNLTIDELQKCINKHLPVIIPIQAYSRKPNFKYCQSWNHGHYVIPIGYDDKRIYFQDPSSKSRTFLTYEELNDRWHDREATGRKLYHFGMIIYGKKKSRNTHMK